MTLLADPMQIERAEVVEMLVMTTQEVRAKLIAAARGRISWRASKSKVGRLATFRRKVTE